MITSRKVSPFTSPTMVHPKIYFLDAPVLLFTWFRNSTKPQGNGIYRFLQRVASDTYNHLAVCCGRKISPIQRLLERSLDILPALYIDCWNGFVSVEVSKLSLRSYLCEDPTFLLARDKQVEESLRGRQTALAIRSPLVMVLGMPRSQIDVKSTGSPALRWKQDLLSIF
ncbi:hypothetical protein RRG08_055921 [Elysia crispata]|uniref:Uncharacterized protein n=1 Tax=Elysia crispata TaxID=231223 RepID=A0AAE1CSA0_9GAST|nr:hypothetical protein RRG08_055921 [Elysia crispata]